jgi:8-amino-7-oxononanoate synthase
LKRTPQALETALSQLKQQHLWRERTSVESYATPGNRVRVRLAGRELIDFSGNDYLGLAHHPKVIEAMQACAARYGAGSGASHLVTGHGAEHERLEEALAELTGRPRALLFSTGYMANLAALSALAGRGETILLDRLSHASLIDGALLSGARIRRYAHREIAALERALLEHPGCAMVASDGVFSMDGDIAPVRDLARLASAHGVWLLIDDAHGLGVLGASGGGCLEQAGLTVEEVPVLVGTLGKALGSFGAFIAGSRDLIELLIQRSRSYIYTTALPQPVAAATRAALRLAQAESWRRERVLALSARFAEAARALGLPLARSSTPIQPLILGDSQAALRVQQRLLEAGFCVVAIRSPTVPRGSERIRITLSAAHTETEVDALVESLQRACGEEHCEGGRV